ncbi:MAG: PqqD family protein [Kiritimatiellae bacterium]|jgi:hypothetical protein|nr:PqqD family protein [Kiritimatiellia bacterium]
MIGLEDIYVQQDDLVFRNVGGEAMIIPIKGKLADMRNIYTLTAVAEFVWESLGEGVTVSDVLDKIVSEFDVSTEVAEQDLKELIDDLVANDLVEKK